MANIPATLCNSETREPPKDSGVVQVFGFVPILCLGFGFSSKSRKPSLNAALTTLLNDAFRRCW